MTEYFDRLFEPLTDPAEATDGRPRVLTRMRDRSHGLSMLSRLAVGDRTVLQEAGLSAPSTYDTQLHEWALGWRGADRSYYLVSGGPTKVDWDGSALAGLQAVAHTHALRAVDRDAVDEGPPTSGTPGRRMKVADALSRWQRHFALPIGAMPGDLWYLFPSNHDIGAVYQAAQSISEFVYTPFRLGPDGWLSREHGQTISVQYGPVTAALRSNAAELVRALPQDDLRAEAGLAAAEKAVVQYLWSPVKFRNGDIIFGGGWMQVDPARGLGGRAPELAWFRESGPSGAMSRADVRAFVRRAAAL